MKEKTWANVRQDPAQDIYHVEIAVAGFLLRRVAQEVWEEMKVEERARLTRQPATFFSDGYQRHIESTVASHVAHKISKFAMPEIRALLSKAVSGDVKVMVSSLFRELTPGAVEELLHEEVE